MSVGTVLAVADVAYPEPGIQSSPRVLVVEEQRDLREAYRDFLLGLGYQAIVCDSTRHAVRMIETQAADVAFISMQAGNLDIAVIEKIKRRRPEMEVVVLSSDCTVESVVKAIKAGAYSYLSKPFTVHQLKDVLQQVTRNLPVVAEFRRTDDNSPSAIGFGRPLRLGHSGEMQTLYRMAAKCARSSHPVLILGESGTGKESLARAIHNAGPYADEPFIAIDCGSSDPTALALFGAEDAHDGPLHPGCFERARGGTIFLADVDKLSAALQSMITRAIHTRTVQPAGSARTKEVSARVIAASEANLSSIVSSGAFLKHLHFALSVLTLRIPPLRERPGDIVRLAQEFVNRVQEASDKWVHLSAEAIEVLVSHNWENNVRELEHCLEAATSRCSGNVIRRCDLDLGSPHTAPLSSLPTAEVTPLYELERAAILGAIVTADGDKAKAAELLGIGKTTLYRKIKEYGVKV